MRQYNGVSFIPTDVWQQPDSTFTVDSSGHSIGGVMPPYFFKSQMPAEVLDTAIYINQKELFSVLVACRLWAHLMPRLIVKILSDNQTTVCVINTGCSKSEFSQACLCEIRYLCAQQDLRIRAEYLPGCKNEFLDALSRACGPNVSDSERFWNKFLTLTVGMDLCEHTPDLTLPITYW